MAFYNENHPGLILPTANTGIAAITINATNLRGYFSKSDIADLLEPSNCLGIRIYNILTQNGKSRLMAVGVDEDGMELINLYMLSHDADSTSHKMPADKIANQMRSVAFALANGAQGGTFGTEKQSRFASFFSEAMLNPLLAETNGFTGIAFHELNMANLHMEDLLSDIAGRKSFLNTHVAVASNIDQGAGTIIVNTNSQSNHVLCDIPCPGNCFKRVLVDNVITSVRILDPEVSTGTVQNNDPYLIKW